MTIGHAMPLPNGLSGSRIPRICFVVLLLLTIPICAQTQNRDEISVKIDRVGEAGGWPSFRSESVDSGCPTLGFMRVGRRMSSSE